MRTPRLPLASWCRIALLGLAASAAALGAGKQPMIEIWPEGVPGLQADATPEILTDGWTRNVHHPTLTVFQPAKPVGAALVICPGGGYTNLSIQNEGGLMAERMNAAGVTVFVLRYRLKEYGHPAPLRDVLRAIRLVRSRAAEFGIDPHRIGVLGSSAGGHLAACAATMYDEADGKTGAALDAVSARPDFAVLLYPVITLQEEAYVHRGSRQSLLGEHPDPALLARLSPDTRVTRDTPPTILFHAADDTSVPPQNSRRFDAALRKAGGDSELVIYPRGGHGFGMHRDVGAAATWPDRCEAWMRSHGWLTTTALSHSP